MHFSQAQGSSDPAGAHLVLYDGVCDLCSRGVQFMLAHAMCAAGVLPKRLLDCAYDIVARTRYRLGGRYEQCVAPHPEFTARFVD